MLNNLFYSNIIFYMSAFDQFVQFSYYWSHMTCRMHSTNVSLVISYILLIISLYFFNIITSNFNFIKYIFDICKKIYNICMESIKNATLSKLEQLSIIFFFFIAIIFFNVSGLATYSLTITATLVFPVFIVYIYFVWMYIWGIHVRSWSLLTLFLPQGLPLPLVILFIFLEIVSNFARLISLSVRLFANMVAGHIMFKLITSASFKVFSIKFIFPWIVLVILFILVYSLESFIALLQAYVFILLLNLYLKDFIITNNCA